MKFWVAGSEVYSIKCRFSQSSYVNSMFWCRISGLIPPHLGVCLPSIFSGLSLAQSDVCVTTAVAESERWQGWILDWPSQVPPQNVMIYSWQLDANWHLFIFVKRSISFDIWQCIEDISTDDQSVTNHYASVWYSASGGRLEHNIKVIILRFSIGVEASWTKCYESWVAGPQSHRKRCILAIWCHNRFIMRCLCFCLALSTTLS